MNIKKVNKSMVNDMSVLPARVTIENANLVMQILRKQLDSVDGAVWVDLSTIEYCDSAGIAVFIEAKIYASRLACKITYQSPPKQLKDLATFLKVAKLLFSA